MSHVCVVKKIAHSLTVLQSEVTHSRILDFLTGKETESYGQRRVQ